MHLNFPSNANQSNLHPSLLSFQIFQCHFYIVHISVGQEIKAQGKWPLSLLHARIMLWV